MIDIFQQQFNKFLVTLPFMIFLVTLNHSNRYLWCNSLSYLHLFKLTSYSNLGTLIRIHFQCFINPMSFMINLVDSHDSRSSTSVATETSYDPPHLSVVVYVVGFIRLCESWCKFKVKSVVVHSFVNLFYAFVTYVCLCCGPPLLPNHTSLRTTML